MQTLTVSGVPNLTFAANKNLFVGTNETIVLEGVLFVGYSRLSLTVTNFSSSAGAASFTVYASDDGIHYYTSGTTLGPIAPGSTSNISATSITAGFLRVTATSAATSNFDCYLLCIA